MIKLTIITRPNSMTLQNAKQTEANGNLGSWIAIGTSTEIWQG